MNTKNIDFATLEVDGIDYRDYPDFCDAYISAGCYLNGTELTDSELDELNEDGCLVHEVVWNKLY